MNYEQMSDFEINKAVATALPMDWSWQDSSVYCTDGEEFDPCNNPADAWPVIAESEIDVQFRQGTKCPPMARHINFYCVDKNPLRAAMIVFLMMREDKSDAIDA